MSLPFGNAALHHCWSVRNILGPMRNVQSEDVFSMLLLYSSTKRLHFTSSTPLVEYWEGNFTLNTLQLKCCTHLCEIYSVFYWFSPLATKHLCFDYILNFDINFDISRWGGTPSEPGPFRQLELCHRFAHQSQYYTCLECPTVSMPRSLSGPHYLHFLSEVRRGRVRRSRCMLLE